MYVLCACVYDFSVLQSGTEPEKIIRGGESITNFLFNNCIYLSLMANKKHIFYLQILAQLTAMLKLLSRTL
jgi:hypothetical protein